MTVVGEHARAQAGLAAQRGKAPADLGRGHRDHFHRQRKGPQHGANQLALVGNAHEAFGQVGHDLLAGECRPAALDHVAAAVDLVGAVDVHRQALDFGGLEHR